MLLSACRRGPLLPNSVAKRPALAGVAVSSTGEAFFTGVGLGTNLRYHDERCYGRVGTRERRGREMAQGSLLNFSCLVSGIRPVGKKAHNEMPHSGELGSQRAAAVSRKEQFRLPQCGCCRRSAAIRLHNTRDRRMRERASAGAAPLGDGWTRASTEVRRRGPPASHCGTAWQGGDAWTPNPRTEAHAVKTAGEKKRAVGRISRRWWRVRAVRPMRRCAASGVSRSRRNEHELCRPRVISKLGTTYSTYEILS
jgi:hypothetical protein